MSHLTLPDDPSNADASITPVQLAAHLAARMCHDFISPAGAIVSGLDLLDDPTAQDMREEAMNLIGASAKKLVALLAFDRVAFGGSSAAETFDTRELERLTREVFAHGRSTLQWSSTAESLPKPAARVVMNLAQLGAGALPIGGTVKVAVGAGDQTVISVHASGTRVRLRPEVVEGLNGAPLSDGLSGHWVQAYFLRKQIDSVGGSLDIAVGEGEATICAHLPL
jgi:histidine phosphotransferase ChpT